MPTAVLIDGGFYLRRYLQSRGDKSPGEAARDLHWMCRQHLKQGDGERRLYRIFFYDCPPLMKKAHHPLPRRRSISHAPPWRGGDLHFMKS